MKDSNIENTVPSNLEEEVAAEVVEDSGDKVVETDIDSKIGQSKCPKCGATDITLDIKTGKLRCNFCRFEFDPVKVSGLEEDVKKLRGKVQTSGTKKIDKDASDLITIKCESC